jgi:hypothetical protein
MRAKIGILLGSRRFFAIVLALLVLNAAWIALSGRYSMAYDENTRLGTIELYADRWLPFWSEAPAGSESLGGVARDPSYLYHYLLSFPYRLLELVTQSQFVQVLVLRFINIGIFLAGVVVYRRVLLRTGASPPLVQALLMVFVLLPAVPFLAAQISYDNALFLVSGVAILLAMQITEQLRRTAKFSPLRLALWLSFCLLASLVKYAFLPIFAALGLWLLYSGWKHKALPSLRPAFIRLRLLHRVGLIVLLVVCAGLFVERYGVNMIRYHTPTPECDQVLSVQACQTYGPWQRNHELYQQKQAGSLPDSGSRDPVSFTASHWLKAMAHQMVFTLNGRSDYFKIGDPLPLPKLLVVGGGGLGVILSAFWYRTLRKKYNLDLLMVVIVVYVAALWLQGYMDFLRLGQPVALQGRYLMPVLPLVLVIMGLAYRQTLRRFYQWRLALAAVGILILLVQGGAATFIVRSDERWYWQNNPMVEANQTARQILKPFVIGG